MGGIEEQNYIKALSGGDEHAFSFLFSLYFPKVKRFIASLLQDEAAAEDLSQDIFVRVWLNRSSMELVENFNAYLYQAARNAVYQYIRRALLFQEYGEKQQQAAYYKEREEHDSIEEVLCADELELLIQITVEKMPLQRRRIYEMSRKEGKSNEEIANLLMISKRTVENHLTQALADIRKILKMLILFI